jgi:hypothetical protein
MINECSVKSTVSTSIISMFYHATKVQGLHHLSQPPGYPFSITFWFFIISLHHRNTFFILNITFAFTFLSLCSIKSEYVLMAISCHTRLRWEMAPKLDSSMISGVGIWPLRRLFRFILYCLRKRCLCCDSLENLWWFQSIEHELC